MRLTLRTLLAYMDDILDPADQEELGRKIESSAFATELIHRSRDAVRRLRLSAPDVLAVDSDDIHGDDHSLDANTAAEYLDNTLSPDAVAEFERTCLEAGPQADMLLAEAASCHHVLTMVLGEPAEVDGDLRQRMYNLLQKHGGQQLRIEPAHSTPGLAAAAVAAPAPIRGGRPADPDEASVPDFMLAAAREERRARRRLAMRLVSAALVGGALALVFWPGGDVKSPDEVADADPSKLANVAVGDTDGAAQTASTPEAAADSSTGSDEAPPFDPSTSGAARAAATTTYAAATKNEAAADVAARPADAATEGPTLPPVADTTTPPTEAATAPPGDPTAAPPIPAEATVPDAAATAADAAVETAAAASEVVPSEPPMTGDVASDATPSTPASPTATIPSESPLLPPVVPDADAAVSPAPPGDEMPAATTTADAGTPPATGDATALPPAVEPEGPRQVGAYLGNNDVLLWFDSAAEAWIRLPPRSALTAGDRLLSLPTYRTHVVLGDVNTYLADGAELDLAAPSGAGALALVAPYGQFLFNSGLNGNRLELTMGDQVRVVTLAPSSSLAIDVRRKFQPGAVPGVEPAPTEVTWYLTSGKATWTGVGPEESTAEAPATWTTAAGADSLPEAIKELPKWVDEESISPNERRARDTVAEALAAGEPVSTRLLELTDPATRGRLTEVRALAARSGAYVGQFDPLVKALGDVAQRASWESQIATLRDAIARDPDAAKEIAEAFATQRGETASKDLMEMLIGFDAAAVGTTREQVQNGALVRLIRWMAHDDLVYRILSSYDVNEILGTNYLGGYRPQHTLDQRKRELRHYWDRLERGELMPKAAKAE